MNEFRSLTPWLISCLALGASAQEAPELVVQSTLGRAQVLSIRPDASLLAIGGEASIQLWTREGRLLRSLPRERSVHHLALNPVHDLLVVHDTLIDLAGGPLAKLETIYTGQLYVWSRDGERLALGTPAETRIFSRDGQQEARISGYSGCFAFSPSGEELYAATVKTQNQESTVSVGVWSVSGKLLRRIPIGPGELKGIALSADGTRMILQHTRHGIDEEGPLVSLWTTEGELIRVLQTGQGAGGPVFALADGSFLSNEKIETKAEVRHWSADGALLWRLRDRSALAAAGDFFVGRIPSEGAGDPWAEWHYKYFDLQGDTLQELPAQRPSIRAIAASPVADLLACSDEHGQIRVWRTTGETLATFVPRDALGEPLIAGNIGRPPLAFSADGNSLVLRWQEEKYKEFLLRFSLSGELLEKRALEYGDRTAAELAWHWIGPGRSLRANEEIAMPDGRHILRLGSRLELQPMGQPRAKRSEWIPDNMSGYHEFLFGGDNQRFYALRYDQTLQVRDARDGHLLAKMRAESDAKELCASPSGQNLAYLGGRVDGGVIVTDADGAPVARGQHPSATSLAGMRGPVFTHDGKGVVSAAEDGTIRLWLWERDQAVTYMFAGNSWIMYTDDGLFDGSRDGSQMLGMTLGAKTFTVDQFALKQNRPDLILERLGVGDAPGETLSSGTPSSGTPSSETSDAAARGLLVREGEPGALTSGATGRSLIEYFRDQFRRRLRRAGLSEEQLSATLHAPEVRIQRAEAKEGLAVIQVAAEDSLFALASLHVWINGVAVARQELTQKSHASTLSLPLGTGGNDIEVSVVNSQGVESLRALTTLVNEKAGPHKLHILALGVSDYRDDALDLGFAHKDAQDLAAALEANARARFEPVSSHVLVNAEVTRASVAALVEVVRETQIDDTLVLFVAGHGVHDTDSASTWYFLTHETDLEHLSETAVPFEQLQRLLSEAPARNKLFLMDTCESGELETDAIALAPAPDSMRARTSKKLAQRLGGSSETAASRTLLRSVDRDRYIFYDLQRRTGAVIYSSSRGSEFSYEDPAIENGWFTEQLLGALAPDGADENHDGWVDTSELRRYVGPRVAAQTSGRQHPSVDRDNVHQAIRLPARQ